MHHFLDLSQLSYEQIYSLLEKAKAFKKDRLFPTYSQHRMANLFYEPSTRTRVSFELAAANLSLPVTNLDLNFSSERKGESIEDTIANLAAMGINTFVIRHSQEGVQQALAKKFKDKVHIINAGDGKNSHPSQAMLDLMTILEHKPDIQSLSIAIVGNLKHSRVAKSLQKAFSILGLQDLRLVCPDIWRPDENSYGKIESSLEKGLRDVDVIICLRVQNERLTENEKIDLDSYIKDYKVSAANINLAKPDAMIMHPGPINRDVELDSTLIDGPQSYILQQVSNGVFMRSAIIDLLLR